MFNVHFTKSSQIPPVSRIPLSTLSIALWVLFCFFICFFYSKPALAEGQSIQEARQKQLRAIHSFEANGKVSFTHGKHGGNASFEWKQSKDHYSILLIGALGIAAVRINNNGQEISLTTSRGEKHFAKSAEQLIKETLGWDIPVTPLVYWLRGIPAPGKSESRGLLDKQGRLVLLEQQGWKIRYQTYINVSGVELPQKMLLEHGPVRVRFIFKNWVW